MGLLSLGGCVRFKPAEDPTRFYLLVAAAATPAGAEPAGTLPVVILFPQLPGYLDSQMIALRKSPEELSYAAFHQWAEPLREGLARVLLANLGQQLGSRQVYGPRQGRPETRYLALDVTVLSFDPWLSGEARLRARWRLIDSRTKAVLAAAEAELTRSYVYQPDDLSSAVAALSAALAEWSVPIAEAARAATKAYEPARP